MLLFVKDSEQVRKLYASFSIILSVCSLGLIQYILYVCRLLKLKSVPHSVGFCNQKADLLVGIGNHLYKIPHYVCKYIACLL